MSKVTIDAAEIVDARTDIISLVKRGANRLPFRVIKSEEEDMLDLFKAGRIIFGKSEKKPEVVAVMFGTEPDADLLAKTFATAGLDPAKLTKSEADEVITFAKSDVEKAQGTVLVKSGDAVVAVSGLAKSFDSWGGSSDFVSAIRANTFYPSIYSSQDVFTSCIYSIMSNSNSPDEAASRVAACADDYKNYIVMLTANLPASAFHLDHGFYSLAKSETPVVKSEEPKAEEPVATTETVTTEAAVEGTEAVTEPVAKTEAEIAAEAAKTAETAAVVVEPVAKTEAEIAADISAQVEAQVAAKMAEFAKSQEAPKEPTETLAETIQKSVASAMATALAPINATMAELSSKVEETSVGLAKADAALNGTVIGGASSENLGRVSKTDNSVGAGEPPLLDTAYTPIARAAGQLVRR